MKTNTLGELRAYINQLILEYGENLPVWVTEETTPKILREISDISYVNSEVNGKFIHIEL